MIQPPMGGADELRHHPCAKLRPPRHILEFVHLFQDVQKRMQFLPEDLHRAFL